MVIRGTMLNLTIDCLKAGKTRSVRRAIDMTLTVNADSWPSIISRLKVRRPALLIKASTRSRPLTRVANSLTLSYEARSSCQTSTTFCFSVVCSISFLACSPLSILRHARITLFALSSVRRRAVSKPIPNSTMSVWESSGLSGVQLPLLAPVMMKALPVQSLFWGGTVTNLSRIIFMKNDMAIYLLQVGSWTQDSMWRLRVKGWDC